MTVGLACLCVSLSIFFPAPRKAISRQHMHRLSGLLLVIALLLGRVSLLEHEYDFAAHKPGDTCVTCLHASPLGHAVTNKDKNTLPFLLSEASYVHVTPPLSTVAHHAYRARAPPRLSSLI